MAQVEAQVEHAFGERLAKHCKTEKAEQKKAIAEARKNRTERQADLLAAAHQMPMPNCERLRDLEAVR